MDRSEGWQVLTLWFVVMIFVQTGSGADNPIYTAIGLAALVLVYALPLYLLAGIGEQLLDR